MSQVTFCNIITAYNSMLRNEQNEPSCPNEHATLKDEEMSTENVNHNDKDTTWWLQEDCRDLYGLIISSGANRCSQRSGVLKFGLNASYSLKRRFRHKQVLFLEFGVFEGKDMTRLSAQLHKRDMALTNQKSKISPVKSMLHGFDSFEGLPQDWYNGQYQDDALMFPQGTFDLKGKVPVIYKPDGLTQCDNVRLHKGWFDETVPEFFESNESVPSVVAFVHADADLYESSMVFLEEISRRQLWVVGSVIVFDEYSNYPNWQQGEYKAWSEICQKYKLEYEFLCYHGPSISSAKSKIAFERNRYGYQSLGVIITKIMLA